MGDVVDLASRRRGREARPASPRREELVPNFGSRLEKIRASLEKINRLMEELKRLSAERGDV